MSKVMSKTEAIASERFKSRKKALEWLRSQGHKVATGKFYQDCNAGFPVVGADKSVSKYQVLTYGLALNKKVQPDMDALDSREYNLRKAKAEAKIAEIKAARMERESDRLWLHADDAWSLLAGLLGNLRDCVRHHLYTGQREVVFTAVGDQDRSQEVFEFMDSLIDKAFNETAGGSVNIRFEKDREK